MSQNEENIKMNKRSKIPIRTGIPTYVELVQYAQEREREEEAVQNIDDNVNINIQEEAEQNIEDDVNINIQGEAEQNIKDDVSISI
ncbi:ring-infected erythrocyte surface antigen-like [Formica exsecta]|uniref:ring-infected erythrocyte surface antigen-like n=1 Tax=Formica exsecta TaxID=72781 RepID=UPI0011421603|nr:ring-infected erythrocyte surface antigen-like [Formica exsecta]